MIQTPTKNFGRETNETEELKCVIAEMSIMVENLPLPRWVLQKCFELCGSGNAIMDISVL
jgi:hypothetical protein